MQINNFIFFFASLCKNIGNIRCFDKLFEPNLTKKSFCNFSAEIGPLENLVKIIIFDDFVTFQRRDSNRKRQWAEFFIMNFRNWANDMSFVIFPIMIENH